MRSDYELLGGEPVLRALVDRFYALMDTLPECRGIREMHPADLQSSNDKLRLFLIGRFGGPQTYIETRGHPRLRMRHMPFAIGESEAAQWMRCMDQALDETIENEAYRESLRGFFAGVAQHMRNRV